MRVSFEEFDRCTFLDITALQEEWLKAEDQIDQRFLKLGMLILQPNLDEENRTAPADLFPRRMPPEPEPEPEDEEAHAKAVAFWLDAHRVAEKTQARMRGSY